MTFCFSSLYVGNGPMDGGRWRARGNSTCWRILRQTWSQKTFQIRIDSILFYCSALWRILKGIGSQRHFTYAVGGACWSDVGQVHPARGPQPWGDETHTGDEWGPWHSAGAGGGTSRHTAPAQLARLLARLNLPAGREMLPLLSNRTKAKAHAVR